MLTVWLRCWAAWGTLGYKCGACLILAGSWTTSSTTARTAWTLRAVPPLRPLREASSMGASEYYQDVSRFCAADSDKIVRLLKFVIICPIRYWGGVVPERCRQTHEGEEWNCFFGYRVFPSIKSESGVSFCSVQDTQSVNASTYCKFKTSA